MSDENATSKGRINDLEYVAKLSKSDQEKRNNEKMRKWGGGEKKKTLSIMDTLFQESPCSFNKICRRKQKQKEGKNLEKLQR